MPFFKVNTSQRIQKVMDLFCDDYTKLIHCRNLSVIIAVGKKTVITVLI